MTPSTIIESVRTNVISARAKAGLVATHGQDLLRTGVQTLRDARDVITSAGREVQDVAARAREELWTTLQTGRDQIGHKFTHLATPTRKEEAEARKLEVKARKQRKRAAAQQDAEEETQVPPSAD